MVFLPNKKYNIIYADPPWHFSNWSVKGNVKAPINYYATMSINDICKLPVKDIADKNCVLFIWTCDPIVDKTFEVIKSWGFTYKTMGFVWVKITKQNKPKMGLGYWSRGSTEYCLLATKGKPKRCSKKVAKTIMARATIHSKKPKIIKDKIVELCGDLPRIELFARNVGLFSNNWDYWGNQV